MHIITTFNKIVCSCYDYVVKATDYEFSKPVCHLVLHICLQANLLTISNMRTVITREIRLKTPLISLL